MAEPKKARKRSQGFTDEERAAMRERVRETKTQATKEAAAQEVLAKIAEMPTGDRELAERVHAIVTSAAPELEPRTWYGMPAYAKDGKVICFFRHAGKFKNRYATFGFSDRAHLDDGVMWATDFAVMEMTPAVEKQIVKLVRKALS